MSTTRPASTGSDGHSCAFLFTMDLEPQETFTMRLVVGLHAAVACQIVFGCILPHISHVTPPDAFVNISFMILGAGIVVILIVGGLNRSNRSADADIIDRRCRGMFPITCASLRIAVMHFLGLSPGLGCNAPLSASFLNLGRNLRSARPW